MKICGNLQVLFSHVYKKFEHFWPEGAKVIGRSAVVLGAVQHGLEGVDLAEGGHVE